MKIITKIKFSLIAGLVVMFALLGGAQLAHADDSAGYGFGVSPMKEYMVLNPGETYQSSFIITNPASSGSNIAYEVYVRPFFVDEDYNVVYEEEGNYSQIADWITLDTTEGIIQSNSTAEIRFSVNVPETAPAGGQYALITVRSKDDSNANNNVEDAAGVQIKQVMAISHTIFAEVTGTTIQSGEISAIELPSFMLGGDITGSVSIKNTGNVHGIATYTMQVFPLFSGEEVFTNEEDPETKTILPGRTLYHETTWSETPAVGIFNVIYTVEFEGVTQQVSKLVIKCPIWLLFIIAFVIVAIIIYFIVRAKGRKK